MDKNSISNFNNDWVRNKVTLTTDNWGGEFLDSEGSVWVADGKTLPFAFNRVVELRVLYSLGSGQFNFSYDTNRRIHRCVFIKIFRTYIIFKPKYWLQFR